MEIDDDDPLSDRSPDGVLWSRVNVVEAAPGVLVPADWSFYGKIMDVAGRKGFADFGVIPWSATAYPDDIRHRMFGIFGGYAAMNVEVVRSIMGGMPGVSGDDVERDLLGSVREGVVDEGFGFRTHAVLAKAPVRLAQIKRGPAAFRLQTGQWWSSRVDTAGLRPGVDARAALTDAMDRFGAAIRWQARGRMFMQGTASALSRYAEQIGEPQLTGLLMGGSDVEETEVADDLWELAAARLDLATFLARHGFHGPNIGNVDSRSWREDPAPVERLLPNLREAERPSARRARVGPARDAAVATLLAELPRKDRLGAKMSLKLGPIAAASLEKTKATMLLSMDVARTAIRTIGAELTAAGRLADPEDAFHFFGEELVAAGREDLRDKARRRKAARERYLTLEVPESWEGQPVLVTRTADLERPRATALTGLGVGTEIVEGPVRIVLDPGDDIEVENGDILVCPTTDPSWVALMTVAGGLVIDIGGAVSHGAVVAREIGIPCVIGTHTGTRDLRDGDVVRVDGARGTVEVLKPAGG